MESYLLIGAIITFFSCIASLPGTEQGKAPGLFFSWFIIFMITLFVYHNVDNSITYKVRELEKNTVFTIEDKSGLYDIKDSVWINMSKRVIDPEDSVAMRCVIIKKL